MGSEHKAETPGPKARSQPVPAANGPVTISTRVRLRFAKCGVLRMVSHHDLLRCLERALRRAELPMAYSQGFNPRPKIVFPLALGLGIEGRREVLELDLAEALEPSEVLRRLGAALPEGFDLIEAVPAGPGRAARPLAALYEMEVCPARREEAQASLEALLAREQVPYTRHRPDRGRSIELDLRAFVLDAELDPKGVLRLRLKITPEGSARPEEVIEALGLRDLLDEGAVLVRSDVELAPQHQSNVAQGARPAVPDDGQTPVSHPPREERPSA